MANVTEEVLRLIVEQQGAQGIADLRKQLDLTKGSLDALADSYRQGNISLAQYTEHAQPLQRRMEALEGATTQAAGKFKGLAQAGQATGRVFQDLVQGGFGGILNNLEQVGTAIGGLLGKAPAFGAALGGALTVIGTAAYVAGPAVWGFFSRLIEGSNAVPKATDGLKGLETQLKGNTDQLDKLREKQSLTNAELATFHRLTTEQLALEAKVEAARKAKAAAERVKSFETDAQQEQKKAFTEGLKDVPGGPESMTPAVSKLLREERSQQKAAILKQEDEVAGRQADTRAKVKAGTATPADLERSTVDQIKARQLAKQRAALAETDAQRDDRARGLVGQAMDGDAAAELKLKGMADARPDLFSAAQKKPIYDAAPEQIDLERRGREQAARQEAEAHTRKAAEDVSQAQWDYEQEEFDRGNTDYSHNAKARRSRDTERMRRRMKLAPRGPAQPPPDARGALIAAQDQRQQNDLRRLGYEVDKEGHIVAYPGGEKAPQGVPLGPMGLPGAGMRSVAPEAPAAPKPPAGPAPVTIHPDLPATLSPPAPPPMPVPVPGPMPAGAVPPEFTDAFGPGLESYLGGDVAAEYGIDLAGLAAPPGKPQAMPRQAVPKPWNPYTKPGMPSRSRRRAVLAREAGGSGSLRPDDEARDAVGAEAEGGLRPDDEARARVGAPKRRGPLDPDDKARAKAGADPAEALSGQLEKSVSIQGANNTRVWKAVQHIQGELAKLSSNVEMSSQTFLDRGNNI